MQALMPSSATADSVPALHAVRGLKCKCDAEAEERRESQTVPGLNRSNWYGMCSFVTS